MRGGKLVVQSKDQGLWDLETWLWIPIYFLTGQWPPILLPHDTQQISLCYTVGQVHFISLIFYWPFIGMC